MKKNQFSNRKMVATIQVIAISICALLWFTPSFAQSKIDKQSKISLTDEGLLVKRLSEAHLIDEINGFVIEKKQNMLYINGQKQTNEIAAQYLASIIQEQIRVEVYSFRERVRQHPQSSILQVLLPVTLSSPCVDTKPVKPGC